jgi:hypothetical protein
MASCGIMICWPRRANQGVIPLAGGRQVRAKSEARARPDRVRMPAQHISDRQPQASSVSVRSSTLQQRDSAKLSSQSYTRSWPFTLDVQPTDLTPLNARLDTKPSTTAEMAVSPLAHLAICVGGIYTSFIIWALVSLPHFVV